MRWAFYVVRCSRDGSLYAGTSTDVPRRVREHNGSTRGARYTSARRPVVLVFVEGCETQSAALKAEAAFRRLSKRAKELKILGWSGTFVDKTGQA